MITRSSTKSTTSSAPASKNARTAAKPTSKASPTKTSTKSPSKSPSKPSSRTKTAPKFPEDIDREDELDEDGRSDAGMQEDDEEELFVPISYKEFNMLAKPMKIVCGTGGHPVAELTATVKELSGKSFGWTISKKVPVQIGDRFRDVTITVNMVLNNSSPKKSAAALKKSVEKRSTSRSVSPVKKGAAKAGAKKRKAEEESETDKDEDGDEGSTEE